MRKMMAVIVGLFIAFGVPAHAAEVSISGTHSQDEIKATCGKEGGSFYSNPHGVYGCSKNGNTVECTAKETCKGYTAERVGQGGTLVGGKHKLLDVLQLPVTGQIKGTQAPAAGAAVSE